MTAGEIKGCSRVDHPTFVANFRQSAQSTDISTVNLSLPDGLQSFVSEQSSQRDYGTSSEYVCELIRKEQDRQQLRGLLAAGAASAPTATPDAAYFDDLRDRARKAAESGAWVKAKQIVRASRPAQTSTKLSRTTRVRNRGGCVWIHRHTGAGLQPHRPPPCDRWPRYAHEWNLPRLRCRPLARYPGLAAGASEGV